MALQHEPFDHMVVETYRRLLQDIAWYQRKWWIYPLLAGLFASLIFLPLSALPMELCIGLVAATMLFVATMPFKLVDKLQEQLNEYVLNYPWVVSRHHQMYPSCPASSP